MASFWYTYAAQKIMNGTLDLDTHDIRCALLMSNTTADTENDAQTISGFTTLDEMDGTNYARKTFASEAVNVDTTNDRGEFDAEDQTWTSLGAGTRAVAGALIFRFITNDTDAIPIAYIDTGGFPITANGGNLTITWNAEGILQADPA